jgi:hypothetical protein
MTQDDPELLIHASPSSCPLPPREGTQPFLAAHAQAKMNHSTAGQWGMYRSHREAIERLLAANDAEDRRSRSLCVLGAGNCNDLDLKWLTQAFAEVHLVDIDADAVSGALRRQGVENVSAIRLHAPVDLTAVADVMSPRNARPPEDAAIARLIELSGEAPMPEIGPFDVVLSPCVLTQLLNPLRETIRRSHPRFDAALRAMRNRHLRLMARLLSDRGRGVLLIDLISSETYDELPRVPAEQLPSFMATFVDRGRSFVGLDPRSIRRAIDGDAALRGTIADVRATPPWLWHLSLRRTFLVYAVQFARRTLQT